MKYKLIHGVKSISSAFGIPDDKYDALSDSMMEFFHEKAETDAVIHQQKQEIEVDYTAMLERYLESGAFEKLALEDVPETHFMIGFVFCNVVIHIKDHIVEAVLTNTLIKKGIMPPTLKKGKRAD